MTDRVLYKKRGRVAYVTINRPEVLNALDRQAHAELLDIWSDFESDDGVWLGVLTGNGDRSFSVGQDLKELNDRTGSGGRASSFGSCGQPGWPRLTDRFDISKPIIARVNGYALGGGFELALACDVIIAADDAEFALPEARLGLVAGAGGAFRLVRQLPVKIAIGHLITGRRMSAARAAEFGLVNEVVSRAHLDACVATWAEDILRCAPLSVRALKEAAMASLDGGLEAAFTRSYRWESRRLGSADALEGPRAFVEKRVPVWTGT